MNKLPNWARWILLLPLSIIAFIIVKLLNSIIFLLGTYFTADPFIFRLFNIFVEGTIAIAAMLATAYYIAPKKKITVVAVLSTILGFLCILSMVVRLPSTPFWEVLLSTILTIGMCVYFCVVVSKKKRMNVPH